jgi:MFS family permease
VAISVVGLRLAESLNISPEMSGWVVGIFTVSYALFEIPTGQMGDRIGARRVLTRVVLWRSAITAFTGMTSNYYVLLLTRFVLSAGRGGRRLVHRVVLVVTGHASGKSRRETSGNRGNGVRSYADNHRPDWSVAQRQSVGAPARGLL